MAKNILVIDDDPLVLRTLKKLFEREGYGAEAVKTASEALIKAQNQEFQLVVADVRMPGMDGLEFTEEIKEMRKKQNKPQLPIIFITGYSSQEAPVKAQELGIKDYILKPFDVDKLLESVKKYLAE